MSSTSIYCVYHITYSGDKFPPNYIGSTSVKQIESGYMGSVGSKKYKDIWKQELKEHPELFHIEIISCHDTRREAIWKELQIQKLFNVVSNPLFVNMSYAIVNGFFGMSTKGIPKSESFKTKMIGNTNASGNKGKPKSLEHREKISRSNLGKTRSAESNRLQSVAMKGKNRRRYILTDPNGIKYDVIGIEDFCKNHDLSAKNITSVASGRVKSYKGWIAIKIPND